MPGAWSDFGAREAARPGRKARQMPEHTPRTLAASARPVDSARRPPLGAPSPSPGEVAEWLKAADCKSARESVRWFESSPLHHYLATSADAFAGTSPDVGSASLRLSTLSARAIGRFAERRTDLADRRNWRLIRSRPIGQVLQGSIKQGMLATTVRVAAVRKGSCVTPIAFGREDATVSIHRSPSACPTERGPARLPAAGRPASVIQGNRAGSAFPRTPSTSASAGRCIFSASNGGRSGADGRAAAPATRHING